MNWYTVRGASSPYSIADFYHFSHWSIAHKKVTEAYGKYTDPYRHLEPAPFIVPPVLTKQDLMCQPLLRLLWTTAFNTLRQAHQIVFVGYSFPATDIASSHLFAEALATCENGLPKITVVDLAREDEANKKEEIRKNYRRVFPDMDDSDFHFEGASLWAKQFVEQDWVGKEVRLG